MNFFYDTGVLAADTNSEYPLGRDLNLIMLAFVAGIFCLAGIMVFLDLPAERLKIKEDDKAKMNIAPNPYADFLERINYRGVIPPEFICPITLCIMHDPVCIKGGHDAHVFERSAIEKWMSEGNRMNPLTGELLPSSTKLIRRKNLVKQINDWLRQLRGACLSGSVGFHAEASRSRSASSAAKSRYSLSPS